MIDFFEETLKKFDDKEFVNSIKKDMERACEDIKNKKIKVSSKDYIDWLTNFCLLNDVCDDEGALYTYKGIDAENSNLLSYFVDYLEEIAEKQSIAIGSEDVCCFNNEEIVFEYNDEYYKAFRIYGQGSFSCVEHLEDNFDFNVNSVYVKL